jgi:cytochrome P450
MAGLAKVLAMTAEAASALEFDPLDPAFLDDPYPFYEPLRAAGPAVRLGATQWVIARHAQVSSLLRDQRLRSEWPEDFQRMRIGDGAGKEFLLRSLLHREDSAHTQLRRLLSACLRLTPTGELRADVKQLVNRCFDQAIEAGRCEVMRDLALPVPAAVACELIGIPAADRPLIQRWGLDIIKAFNVITVEADRAPVNTAAGQLRVYLTELLGRPAGKLAQIAGLIGEADQRGELSRSEMIDNLIFLLVSGFTTTVHVIATVCAVLAGHPEVFAELKADPAAAGAAVEEIIRYDAPIQHISRFAAARIDLDGVVIRPGRVVHLLLGSANRDSRVFMAPGRIDIRRSPNPHVSFGAGIHSCLGASLGRLEAVTVVDTILERCEAFVPDGEFIRRRLQVFRSYERIPVSVAAA